MLKKGCPIKLTLVFRHPASTAVPHTMGGGASSIDDRTLILHEVESQKLKPVDGSDMLDYDTAILEITKLRSFFHMLDVDSIRAGLDEIENGRGGAGGSAEQPGQGCAQLSDGEKAVRGQAIASVLKAKMSQRFDSLHESFLSIDTDKSGYISQREFQEACWNWGILLSPEDFELLNATYHHQERLGDLDKGINYAEFIALLTNETHYTAGSGSGKENPELAHIVRTKVLGGVDTMREAFKKLDRDGSGTVERAEMRLMLETYNICCAEKEFDELMRVYDRNGDGKFSYGEFVQLIQRNGN